MLNQTFEIAAPSPTNTTDFTLSVPDPSNIVVSVRSNQVYFDCYSQTPDDGVVQTISKQFTYKPVGFSWTDSDRLNFICWVLIASGTYILLERY